MTTSEFFGRFHEWFRKKAGVLLVGLPLLLNPVPASRPRVTRWGVYYTATYTTWRKAALPLAEKYIGPKHEGPLAVFVENIVEKPKTSKLSFPKGDVDNYAKGPLDIINDTERAWVDDKQIVFLAVTKRFAEPGEQPRTELHWFPLDDKEQ
jgi:Holliday junction resolvase RusA-like endonuclease